MPLDLSVVGVEGEPVERAWTSKDAILYALGLGAGLGDPLRDLDFTTENSAGVDQKVLPTFGVLLAQGGGRRRWGDFNPALLVHAEQAVTLHARIPVEGAVTSTGKVTGIYDKGKAAIVRLENSATYVDTGKPAFSTRFAAYIRDAGGCGTAGDEVADPPKMPERDPDHETSYVTRRDQALLYRLSGDRNPLHSDPAHPALQFMGVDRPILHGLCTFGFTGRALLHTLCGSDVERFQSVDVRFSKPVLPGDTLTVRMWVESPGTAIFQTVNQDGTVVIDGGVFKYGA